MTNHSMVKKNNLFLHIGFPKTGTTSIQTYLFDNRTSLEEKGIIYPTPIGGREAHHINALLYHRQLFPDWDFPWDPQTSRDADKYQIKLREIHEKIIEKFSDIETNNNTLILSSEYFLETFHTVDSMVNLVNNFPDFNVYIILYIRRIDQIINSVMMESAKYYAAFTEENIHKEVEFRKNQQLRLSEKLQNWETVLGKDNIILRPFERMQLINGDVINDFMHIVAPHIAHSRTIVEEKNVKISTESALFLAKSIAFPSWKRSSADNFILQTILNSNLLRKNSRMPQHLLSPLQRLELLEKLKPTYTSLAKRYLKREDGVLFKEDSPNEDDNWASLGSLTLEDVIPIYSELIKSLFEKIEHLETSNQNRSERKVGDTSQEEQVSKLTRQIDIERQNLNKLRQSWSWRLTRPLRVIHLFIFDNKRFRESLSKSSFRSK